MDLYRSRLDDPRDTLYAAARLAAEPVTALAVERILTLLVDLAFACSSHSR